MKTNLSMLKAYPIGSIYISTNNISPAFLFGGSWEELKDHATLMTDSSATLGNYSGNNTMSVEQMPKHNHGLGMFIYNGGNTAVGKARYGFGYSTGGGMMAIRSALDESATSELSYGNRATGGSALLSIPYVSQDVEKNRLIFSGSIFLRRWSE